MMLLEGGGCGRRHVEQCGGVPSAERVFMRVLSHELFFSLRLVGCSVFA